MSMKKSMIDIKKLNREKEIKKDKWGGDESEERYCQIQK